MPRSLGDRLRLMVITAPGPRAGSLLDVVTECVAAGATAIQLRDKQANGRELYEQAVELGPSVQARGALFLVNDRVDVAMAARADGAHLGPDDVPLAALRPCVPEGFLLGYSTDDPQMARRAQADGADYLGVGAVFGTHSKAGLGEEAIGCARLRRVLEAVSIPGVAIGGIGPDNAEVVARTGAGLAVLGAVMDAERPGDVVTRLLAVLSGQGTRGAARGAP